MERELALLRSRDENASRRPPPSETAYDRHDGYRRERSPVRREAEYPSQRDYPPQREYSRNDRMGYDGNRGDDDRGRGYYNGRSDASTYRGGGGGMGMDGHGPSGVGDAYRNAVSYPIQGRGGYNQRDDPQHASGGQMGGASGYGSRGGVGYGQSSQSAGYASSAGKLGLGGAPPPGWPSTDYDKSNANRPPFAWN